MFVIPVPAQSAEGPLACKLQWQLGAKGVREGWGAEGRLRALHNPVRIMASQCELP